MPVGRSTRHLRFAPRWLHSSPPGRRQERVAGTSFRQVQPTGSAHGFGRASSSPIRSGNRSRERRLRRALQRDSSRESTRVATGPFQARSSSCLTTQSPPTVGSNGPSGLPKTGRSSPFSRPRRGQRVSTSRAVRPSRIRFSRSEAGRPGPRSRWRRPRSTLRWPERTGATRNVA